MKRGYCGIGVYHPKTEVNIGTLWRSAHNLGADYIFTIGKRYKKQTSDTTKAYRHVPLFEYTSMQEFKEHLPLGSTLVFVEQADGAHDLKHFVHPESAVYVLGAEDYGIPAEMIRGFPKVAIESPMCLNVAVAGSIVLYDRQTKLL